MSGRTMDTNNLSPDSLAAIIDYTLLRPEVTMVEYSEFLREASAWGFASVFVPPCYVPLASGMLSATGVRVGTPVSFPYGYATPETKVAEALDALEEGAEELDVVMNVSAALSGEWELGGEDIGAVGKAVRGWEELSRKGPVVIKLIIEAPYLSEDQKVEACRRAVSAGVDFVKTATGLGPGGATVEDVALMRRVVGQELGVKAAGGIRTFDDVRAMLEAGANRIGTSAGPKVMETFLREYG